MKAGALLTAGAILPVGFLNQAFAAPSHNQGPIPFKPIEPSDKDALVLPEGFDYTIIRKWGIW